MFRGMYRGSGQGGGSGGDQHNLGWYATPEALRTAHATATAGDWAIVGSTDTVWIWDTDTNAWKDSDQKGQVASVNGQTGTVVLTASDVGAATAAQGAKADTAVQPADLATVATTGDYDDLTNKPTIPAAQVNSDWNASSGVAQILNKPTLGTAASADTTDFATAAQGALADTAIQSVKTINGQSIVGTGNVTVSGLPDQTGQSGKFLTTNGTDASWSNKPLVNTYTGNYGAIGILGTVGGLGTGNVVIGSNATANGNYAPVAIGASASCGSGGHASIAIGNSAKAFGNTSVSIGRAAEASAECAIQIGGSTNGQSHVNNKANTFMVANNNGNFEMMSADGTVPADRLKNAINKYSTMPTAASTNEGWIVQFTGTTDSTYTHGHLYECVSDGQDPATYSWTEVQLGGGGSSYTAGTGISIDANNEISVVDPVLVNKTTLTNSLAILGSVSGTGNNVCVGAGSVAQGQGQTVIGQGGQSYSNYNIVIGRASIAASSNNTIICNNSNTSSSSRYNVVIGCSQVYVSGSNTIQINASSSPITNSDSNTFKVANANGNFEIMSADGTIPAARHAALPSADGTYVLKLVIASGVPTLSWVAE